MKSGFSLVEVIVALVVLEVAILGAVGIVVVASGTMAEAEDIILRFYADGRREWFGHPARLTVEGKRPPGPASPD